MNLYDNLICDEYNESSFTKKNYKENFYNLLSTEGFDFSDIDYSTKLPKSLIPVIDNETEPFNKFNVCLADLHKNKLVNILDAVSFLVNDYLEATIALKCLDEMNYISLTNELKKKFNIKNKEEDESKEILSLLDFLE